METISDKEIYWERPWYQMSKSLTRPLKHLSNNAQAAEAYKLDTLNSDEVALVNKNWRKFIKVCKFYFFKLMWTFGYTLIKI